MGTQRDNIILFGLAGRHTYNDPLGGNELGGRQRNGQQCEFHICDSRAVLIALAIDANRRGCSTLVHAKFAKMKLRQDAL